MAIHLNWSLSVSSDQPNASTNATTNTIDHYKVYISTDGTVGENIVRLEDDIAVTTSTLDLDTLSVAAGTYKIYAQAVGEGWIPQQDGAKDERRYLYFVRHAHRYYLNAH